MKRILSLVAIVLLVAPVAMSQEQEYRDTSFRVRLLSASQGLPQATVQQVIQDRLGVLWIATLGGLSSYDGADFMNFIPDPKDASAINDASIHGVCEGPDGDIWCATSKGVSRYSRRELRFVNYRIPGPRVSRARGQGGAPYLEMYSPRFAPDGRLWMLSPGFLVIFDPSRATRQLIPLPREWGHLRLRELKARLEMGPQGQVWLASSHGVRAFSQRDGAPVALEDTHYGLTPGDVDGAVDVFQGGDSSLWILTPRRLAHVVQGRKPHFFPLPEGLDTELRRGWIDRAGNPWCLGRECLVSLDLEKEEWARAQRLRTIHGQRLDLTERDVAGYFQDRNVAWLPCEEGLAFWSTSPSIFTRYDLWTEGHGALPGQQVSGIYCANDTVLWVALQPEGLIRYNRVTHARKHYSAQHGLPHARIQCIDTLANGLLVAGTTSGFISYDQGRDAWKTFHLGTALESVRTRMAGHSVKCFTLIQDGSLAYGAGDSLFIYSRGTDHLSSYPRLAGQRVTDLAYDPSGFLWVGTRTGLSRINLFDSAMHSYSSFHELLGNGDDSPLEVRALDLSLDGTLWIVLRGGLVRVDPGTTSFKLVSQSTFFLTHSINDLLIDVSGNLWFATDSDLGRFCPEDGKFQLHRGVDGASVSDVNARVACQSRYGTLYFGGRRGAFSCNSFQLADESQREARIIISQCLISSAEGVRKVSMWRDDPLELSASDRALTCFFSVLEYVQPERVRYQYMLPSLSRAWVDVQERNVVTIANLPEGQHSLRYRASFAGEQWVEGAPLTIRVSVPLHRSIWPLVVGFTFLVLVLLLLSLRALRARRNAQRMIDDRQMSLDLLQKQQILLYEQNQNASASIEYARRIQQSILPSGVDLAQIVPDHFVLYRPKDKLSGDIYWVSRREQYVYLAMVDCTGHGIPGAMLSIIAYNLLSEIIEDMRATSAAKILQDLSNRVYSNRLHSSSKIDDALDISICVVNTQTQMLDFAGARHSLLHYSLNGLVEYKGDNVFIGDQPSAQFASQQVGYSPSDILYLYTDGFVDQFSAGGDGQKFGQGRFRAMIESVLNLPLNRQGLHLAQTLADWQGDAPQVDDISVLGIRCNFPS